MAASLLFFFSLICVGVLQSAAHDCPITHVCFALDGSGSIGKHWSDVQKFTTDVAGKLKPRAPDFGPEYSSWVFSNSVERLSIPTKSLLWFTEQVNKKDLPGGLTNMYAGVKACFDHLKDISGKRVIVLLTDGKDNGVPKAAEFLEKMKGYSIQIVAVGIGPNIDARYLKGLVSEDNFFISTAMSSLTTKATTATNAICKAAKKDPEPCLDAYHACDFKFDGFDIPPNFWCCGRPDRPLGGSKIISRKGRPIGIVNSNGIVPEFINDDGTMVPVTSKGSPPFSPTHFKPFSMRWPKYASSVGRQSYSGNQATVVKGKCIRLFFTTYQELSTGPKVRVLNNVNVEKRDNKCVVFKLG